MKRVKHSLFASCLLPTFLRVQGVANAFFLGITLNAQSAGVAGTGLAVTDNGSMAIFHNASAIAFSQDVMGVSHSYADINKDFGMHSAPLFYRIGRKGKYGFSVEFRHCKDADFHWQDGMEDHARTWNVEVVYFRGVTKNPSLPLALRYLQVRAYKDVDSKGSVFVNLGTSCHRSMGALDGMASWTIGLQATNLGSKLDGQKPPAQLGLGGAIGLPFNMDNHLQVALDFNYLLSSECRYLQISIGAEYNFPKYGIIRGEYHFGDNDKGAGNYGTLGYGISF